MDFEEFKWALGDSVTIPLLRQAFDNRQPLSDNVNRQMMREFRLYMLIGGMPQALETYLDTNNLSRVDTVKRKILALYEEDFNKIDKSGRASMLFRSIPQQLTSNKSRFSVSGVLGKGNRPYLLEETIANMVDSMTVNVAYHANDPNVGMSLHGSLDAYKLYRPIEVKSSGYKSHVSLDAFCHKFSGRISDRYLIYTKDLRKEGNMLYIPAYMTMFL